MVQIRADCDFFCVNLLEISTAQSQPQSTGVTESVTRTQRHPTGNRRICIRERTR
jgi:hypothetical protein